MRSIKFLPFLNLSYFYLLVNLVLRLILFFHPITQAHFSAGELFKIFVLGAISDVFIYILISLFLWLYLLFLSDAKYQKPSGYIIFFLMLGLLTYITSCNTILNEYGGSLPEVVTYFVTLKTFFFGLLLFLPKYRKKIRFYLFSFVIFLYVVLIIQNAVSEYFFWNEFGVRYNFIAVDYLIYTNEVIGNIVESYPVVPIFATLFSIAGLITYFIVQKSKSYLEELPNLRDKLILSVQLMLLVTASLLVIPALAKTENSNNVFANELQANGIHKFYLAFMNNELDYPKFYKTMPSSEAYTLLAKQIPGVTQESLLRFVHNDGPELKKNVVLITIESYSAEYFRHYGSEESLTPFLDSLMDKSLLFDNLYAVGNRTVRGLEAVTLCLPPTAGESVIKRKDNKNKFSTASIFRQKGYQAKFLYGGDAYFDNMQDFFSGNGYEIIDKKDFKPEEITFSNVWGVCDEDMARKAIQVMNTEAKSGKPFFNHWMTVSNHRPFTYPEGRIDIPGSAKSRKGGVKYTDYALREFFKAAQKQSWFDNTVFVILADHCASSAGKTELPMDKYRIPAIIYSPKIVEAEKCDKLMSQIDLMPTLFGLLHFSYESKFFGQDVLKSDYKPRAFIATYQNLGLIKNDILTILSPKQDVKQYDLKKLPNPNLSSNFQIFFEENKRPTIREDLVRETISYYQTASNVLKKKKYQK